MNLVYGFPLKKITFRLAPDMMRFELQSASPFGSSSHPGVIPSTNPIPRFCIGAARARVATRRPKS